MIDSPYFPYAFALLVALPFVVFIRQFVFSYIKLKNQEIKLLTIKGNSEQRVHAYERLTLFLERLKPSNLVTKFDKNLAPHEFVFLIEKTINDEFDYNASQQLYITAKTWKNVANCKNNMLHLLHKTYENLGNNLSLDDYKTIFLMNYMNEEDFIANCLEELRKENLIVN
ncbi:hypothetical protein H0S70_04745 [Chryseobacterium manosquense]|uniref:DUF4760 domain-containing protein n=1 Tax=Chryseobacterium manosquense TaxID=2754694 RepID=A0A7H1DZ80_9FLAO|nr:hypothetical protein [Chryseobacterium manosquense]QNS42288.1 hypothetical protein H0S70_04745 [Chryseobacterium manosquense]